jgi:hypothetical protein
MFIILPRENVAVAHFNVFTIARAIENLGEDLKLTAARIATISCASLRR